MAPIFQVNAIAEFAGCKTIWLTGCLLVAAVLCLCGCAPLWYHSYDESYPGLRQRLDEAGTNAAMHIVVVHGIGNHAPGYSAPLADGLARLLKLAPQMDSKTSPLVSSKNVTNWLREFSYRDQNHRLVFHEVTWTPTTIGIKSNAFLEDQKLNGHRLYVNRLLKTNLMDEALSDAVLYLNPNFRCAMQEPILQTITNVAPQVRSNESIILIASSLGSKMAFDTAVAYEEDANVQHFAERTTDIVMLANQLPLLHLGTGTDIEADAQTAPETGAKKFLRMSRKHKQNRINKEGKSGNPRDAAIHVVAATDPNDLLSYPLSRRDIVPDGGESGDVTISLSNIYAHNAGAILFVVENPLAAHNNYDLNKWLLKKLVCGYPEHSR